MQDDLRNIYPFLLADTDVDTKEAFQAVMLEAQELQTGRVIDLGPTLGKVFGIGGILLVAADMPQGNYFADIKRTGAFKSCRICPVAADCRCGDAADHPSRRTLLVDDVLRRQALSLATKKARTAMLSNHGLLDEFLELEPRTGMIY